MKQFNKFIENIYKESRYELLDNVKIEWDQIVFKLVDRANPIASLKCKSHGISRTSRFPLDALQCPLMLYKDGRNVYRVISGIFTFQEYCRNPQQVFAIVLNKAPAPRVRELIFLNELTRCLLDQFFLESSSMVATFLNSWFDTEHNSLFRDEKWLALYPHLSCKSKFCKWMGLSSKTFKVKGEG
jgi:hypothetical protein